VEHTCSPSTQDVEAGGTEDFILSQNNNKNQQYLQNCMFFLVKSFVVVGFLFCFVSFFCLFWFGFFETGFL
jgi:integral membrane sensor domain MASE1